MFAELSDATLSAWIHQNRRAIHLREAEEADALAEWSARKRWTMDGSRSAGHRLSRETGISVDAAKKLVARGDALQKMPRTRAAFHDGLASDRVDLLVGAFEPELAEPFLRDEADNLDHLSRRHYPGAKDHMANWKARAREETGTTRDRQAFRGASITVTDDGFVKIDGKFDPIRGDVVAREIERLEQYEFERDWAEAKDRLGDDASFTNLARTRGQRMDDAMVEMARRSAARPNGGISQHTKLHILIGAARFANLLQTVSGLQLTADEVVPLLAQADIDRIVYDLPSRKIAISRQRHFTGALRDAIVYRDQYCQDPSVCDRPARRSQVDHIGPFSRGGMTIDENGGCLCDFHNRLKSDRPRIA